MDESTKDKAEGMAQAVKGTVKESIGKALDKPDLESEGTADKVSGKIQKKVGDVEKVFEK